MKGKVAYAALEFQRFIDRHGLTRFKMHPALPFNSILLQRVLVAAADETQRQALVEALLPAVWERNVDCSDPQAVGQELAAAGFDAEALLAATQDPQVKAKLAQNTEAQSNAAPSAFPPSTSMAKCGSARNGSARSRTTSAAANWAASTAISGRGSTSAIPDSRSPPSSRTSRLQNAKSIFRPPS